MRKLLLTFVALSTIALGAAGCGSEDEAASGASELVPASAFVYGEATLEPEGDQKEAINSILSKFPGGGESGDKIKELIEKGLRESDAPISFKKDIEPWLGDEAAFFAGFGKTNETTVAAVLVATDDEDAALETLEKSAEGKTSEKSYKDQTYLTDESDEAGAVFDGFLVLGSEEGVKAAIDASKGDSKLSDDEGYKKALEDASDDRLGLMYVNSPEIAKAMQQTGVAGTLPPSFKDILKEPVVATVDADNDGVTLEGKVPSDLGGAFALLGQASDLVTELPGDSWLALGQANLGNLVDFYVDAFAQMAGGRDAIEQQLKAATGLDLQRDVIAWMGDFAVFARGTSLSALDGALVIESKDEQASGRFIDAVARLVRQQGAGSGLRVVPRGSDGYTLSSPSVPKPIHLFQRDGRVVLAYGNEAAGDAVAPSEKLGDNADFTSARDSLGDYEVASYVLLQPIFDLIDSTGASSDADWQDAKPYLEPLSALVAGTSGEGDDLKSAVKLIVK
jgi:hypothetical protein